MALLLKKCALLATMATVIQPEGIAADSFPENDSAAGDVPKTDRACDGKMMRKPATLPRLVSWFLLSFGQIVIFSGLYTYVAPTLATKILPRVIGCAGKDSAFARMCIKPVTVDPGRWKLYSKWQNMKIFVLGSLVWIISGMLPANPYSVSKVRMLIPILTDGTALVTTVYSIVMYDRELSELRLILANPSPSTALTVTLTTVVSVVVSGILFLAESTLRRGPRFEFLKLLESVSALWSRCLKLLKKPVNESEYEHGDSNIIDAETADSEEQRALRVEEEAQRRAADPTYRSSN